MRNRDDRMNGHLSDEDLLLAADGELSRRRLRTVRAHLSFCAQCSARQEAMGAVLSDAAAAYKRDLRDSLPPISAARAALREGIAQESRAGGPSWVAALFAPAYSRRWAYNLAFMLLIALALGLLYRQMWLPNFGAIARVQADSLPKQSLTPGFAQGAPQQLCISERLDDTSGIPQAERQQVFREYGVDNRHAGDYELDYLINPGLGGTDDIHNLWPEPFSSTAWNAQVKDQLENRLRQMVCAGQIDLGTAQREIATNWIAAYKKYFHTDKPLSSATASLPKRRDSSQG